MSARVWLVLAVWFTALFTVPVVIEAVKAL